MTMAGRREHKHSTNIVQRQLAHTTCRTQNCAKKEQKKSEKLILRWWIIYEKYGATVSIFRWTFVISHACSSTEATLRMLGSLVYLVYTGSNNEIWGEGNHDNSNKRGGAFKQIFFQHHLLKSNIDLTFIKHYPRVNLTSSHGCSYSFVCYKCICRLLHAIVPDQIGFQSMFSIPLGPQKALEITKSDWQIGTRFDSWLSHKVISNQSLLLRLQHWLDGKYTIW